MPTDLKTLPDTSVVMSVYNDTEYLNESINSILCQTYRNFEFIIVTDGSNIRTQEIIEGYALDDQRIVVLKNDTNMGLTRSLNKAISRARGEFIARQDADDISLPTRLEKQVGFLAQHPSYVLVSCNLEKIDSTGRFLKVIEISSKPYLLDWNFLFFNGIYGHSQVVYRKRQFESSGGYCEAFAYAQDYELWTRLLRIGKFKILNETLVKNREHLHQLSQKRNIQQLECVLKISQSQIESIIGDTLPKREIASLWSFWTFTKLPENLPHIDPLDTVDNNRLKQIFNDFMLLKNLRGQPQSDRISRLIGERYIKWFFYELFVRRRAKPASMYLRHSIEWLGSKTPLFITKVLTEQAHQQFRRFLHLCTNSISPA
ncbi:MAG: glycosyltransferase [Desulfobacterales bacterium]|nr:glycosyltransferase [Desulfobacterales bacterium]